MSINEKVAEAGNILAEECFDASSKGGWWKGKEDGELPPETVCTKLLLMVSEICEGMEGLRKNLKDDKLPQYDMLAVELADTAIRVFDLAGRLGYDLGTIIAEKMAFNAQRADHKQENRSQENGKKF